MERLAIVGAGTDVGGFIGVQPDNGVVLDALPWQGYRNVQVGFGRFLENFETHAGGIAPWRDQENSRLAPRRGPIGEIRPGAVAVSVWERGHPEDVIVSQAFYNVDDEVSIREIKAFLRDQGIVLRHGEQQQRPALTPAILPTRPLSHGRTLRDLTNYR